MATSIILKELGFESDSCSDGLEAIAAVEARHQLEGVPMYEVIFMDFSMPDCNGCDATRKIRSFLSEQEDDDIQPFICCLTAYTENDYKVVAKEAGMDSLLVKPIFRAAARNILFKAGLVELE